MWQWSDSILNQLLVWLLCNNTETVTFHMTAWYLCICLLYDCCLELGLLAVFVTGTHNASCCKHPVHNGTAEGSHHSETDEHNGHHQLEDTQRVTREAKCYPLRPLSYYLP